MPAYFKLYNEYSDYVRFKLYLSDSFNTNYYISAGITRYKFTSTSGSTSISGIVGDKNASSSGSSSTVNIDVYYSDLPYDPGETVTLYAYAQDTSGRYWAIESEDGGFGIDITIPSAEDPYIYDFYVDSSNASAKQASFYISIRDPDSAGFTVKLYAKSNSGTTYYLKDSFEDSGRTSTTLNVSFDENTTYKAYIELYNSNGNLVETSSTVSFDLSLPTPSLDIFSLDESSVDVAQKSAVFIHKVTDIGGSGWDINVYATDVKGSYSGTYLGSLGGASSTNQGVQYTFPYNKLYYVWAEFIPRDGSGSTKTSQIAVDLRLPVVSEFTCSTNQLVGTFDWNISNMSDSYSYKLYIKFSSDSSYSYVSPSYSATSYSYTFARVGTYYCHIVIYNDAGDEVSRSPSSGDITVVTSYNVTDFAWTSNELDAFNSRRSFSTLTKSRWNEFIDYINACVPYFNAKNGTSCDTLSASVKVGNDGVLYANDFKLICEKINEITGATMTGITLSEINAGAIVKGSYFPYMLNFIEKYK